MAKQLITIGTPGAGGGDPAHAAFKKINDNATELYDAAIPDTEEKKTQARTNLGLRGAAVEDVMPVEKGGTGSTGVLEVQEKLNLFRAGQISAASDLGVAGSYGMRALDAGMPFSTWGAFMAFGHLKAVGVNDTQGQFFVPDSGNTLSFRRINGTAAQAWVSIRHSGNTAVDGNGFIKAASPIVQLYADNIHLNEEAQLQDITFEKLGAGDYLIKGSLGFAQESWYIEIPKDANGNVLVAVVYEQLENNDISVKTYAKKFDDETGDIVANLTKPRDIPAGRWIDLRLQEIPQPEVQISESNTPPDFQPTNLAQAVAEALNYDSQ